MNIPHASPADVLASDSVLGLFRKASKPMLLFDYKRHHSARKLKALFLAQNVTMSKRFLDFAALRPGPGSLGGPNGVDDSTM